MKTSLFDFELPENLIADRPANPRDSARMLVVGDVLQDLHVRDLLTFLQAGDVMVFNDTKVIPARLMGKRGEASIEILLHKKLDSRLRGNANIEWQCFTKPGKKLRVGDAVNFADDFSAEVLEKRDDGQVLLRFEEVGFQGKLQRYGAMPLPPYIEKKRHADGGDAATYQTVYAKHEGSVAAPTAGLHFTPELLAAIDAKGVKRVHVTLHVGGGTFLPVKTEDTAEHVMHSEYAEISPEAAEVIAGAKRVIAVGTTSLRTLEAAGGKAFAGETDIFITPGYTFKVVDVLLTNFHLPKSTLFMLVSAFSGLERIKNAYAHAIAQNYRFYSYGDACLLFKNTCHVERSRDIQDPSAALGMTKGKL